MGQFTYFGIMDPQRPEGRGRGHRRGGGREKGRARAKRKIVSGEIRATLLDHVHGMSLREAGQRVQPNLSCFKVASIILTFREENRKVTYILLPNVTLKCCSLRCHNTYMYSSCLLNSTICSLRCIVLLHHITYS